MTDISKNSSRLQINAPMTDLFCTKYGIVWLIDVVFSLIVDNFLWINWLQHFGLEVPSSSHEACFSHEYFHNNSDLIKFHFAIINILIKLLL